MVNHKVMGTKDGNLVVKVGMNFAFIPMNELASLKELPGTPYLVEFNESLAVTQKAIEDHLAFAAELGLADIEDGSFNMSGFTIEHLEKIESTLEAANSLFWEKVGQLPQNYKVWKYLFWEKNTLPVTIEDFWRAVEDGTSLGKDKNGYRDVEKFGPKVFIEKYEDCVRAIRQEIQKRKRDKVSNSQKQIAHELCLLMSSDVNFYILMQSIAPKLRDITDEEGFHSIFQTAIKASKYDIIDPEIHNKQKVVYDVWKSIASQENSDRYNFYIILLNEYPLEINPSFNDEIEAKVVNYQKTPIKDLKTEQRVLECFFFLSNVFSNQMTTYAQNLALKHCSAELEIFKKTLAELPTDSFIQQLRNDGYFALRRVELHNNFKARRGKIRQLYSQALEAKSAIDNRISSVVLHWIANLGLDPAEALLLENLISNEGMMKAFDAGVDIDVILELYPLK